METLKAFSNASAISDLGPIPPGVHDLPCPICGPGCRAPANRVRRVLRVWHKLPGVLTYCCARCGIHGWARADETRLIDGSHLARLTAEARAREEDIAAHRRQVALGLWGVSQPAVGTPVVAYLQSRGIVLAEVPATLRYLAPRRTVHHPAMIAVFAVPHEVEPGHVTVPREAIRGAHLTFLRPDGCGKASVDPAKIMVGRSTGTPIVVAPIGDGLGLVITEGIEDAASVHVATGLGAWAAGSAGRMPALADAVPAHVESATIVADVDDPGQRGARELARRLKERGIEVRLANAGCGRTAA